jgi:hypothetical protein
MNTPKDLITVAEARELLGVSRQKMADMLRLNILRHFPDPLDRRAKLVSRAAVLALKVREAA